MNPSTPAIFKRPIFLLCLTSVVLMLAVCVCKVSEANQVPAGNTWVREYNAGMSRARPHILGAESAVTRGDLPSATRKYRLAIEVAPIRNDEIDLAFGDVFVKLSEASEKNDYLSNAYDAYKEGYNLKSSYRWRFALRLAAVSALQKNYTQAIEWYKLGVNELYPPTAEVDPNSPTPIIPNFSATSSDMPKLMAYTYSRVGTSWSSVKHKKALVDLKKSVSLDSDTSWQAETWMALGNVIEDLNSTQSLANYREALQAYQKAKQIATVSNDSKMLSVLEVCITDVSNRILAEGPLSP